MPTATATKLPEPSAVKAHDYSGLISMFTRAYEDAREEMRSGRMTGPAREMLQGRISHLKMAIENAQEAELVTEEAVQFGSYASEHSFRLPPRIDDFRGVYGNAEARRFIGHRYLATNPLEIAYLRRLVREGQLVETGIGDMYLEPAMDNRTGEMGEGIWVNASTYTQMARSGRT